MSPRPARCGNLYGIKLAFSRTCRIGIGKPPFPEPPHAECVMLNKGPYIMHTLKFVCDVLNCMEMHHEKKTAMLRR